MKKIIIPFIASALLVACTSEDFEQQVQGDKFAGQVTLTSEPYTFEDGTRTVLTNTGSNIEFKWKNGEAIGIFPVAPTTNNQAKQVLNVSGEATSATFDGAGWALLKGNTYAAYSPYVDVLGSTPYSAVPISMTGQTQDGNGSLTHIGNKYDFMYASASVPSEGNVNFAFNHVGSIIMLELTMPVAGTWSSATLIGTDNVFTTSATMNVSTGAVTSVSKSNSISLALENVSTTAANQTITLYMSALPCTTGALTLKVNNSGTEYSANLATKTLVAGHAYKWTASPAAPVVNYGEAPSNAAAVDLGLSVKWANMNVGATSATGYGTYFAWGEVTGCQRKSSDGSCIAGTMDGYISWTGSTNSNYVSGNSKSNYYWSDYKWCQGSYSSQVKYCKSSSYGTVDNKTTLEPSDDAAIANWGGDWRMPTHAEQTELVNNCYWVWTDSYNGSDIKGYIVYKAKNTSDKGVKATSGSTASSSYSLSDTHIFLPSAGYRDNDWFFIGSSGYYWASSLNESQNSRALRLGFNSGNVSDNDAGSRYSGQSVRAVCP